MRAGKTSIEAVDAGTDADATLVVVLGPTASGKSELAVRIAHSLAGEIVSFDSVQLYRRFDIGSGKLAVADRHGIAHHLIDLLEPNQLFTAGDFARTARVVLDEIARRNRVPILAGGTGFYLRALLQGLPPGPERDESIRTRLLQRELARQGRLHRILRRLDPQSAQRIHPNDSKKVVRALELCILRRRPASELLAREKDPLRGFRIVKIGLDPPRTELFERINGRVVSMFERGLVAEVEAILSSGVSSSVKPFESLGYSQALAYLQGKLTMTEAIQSAQQQTRQYAKRQMTWFRRERGVRWFQQFGPDVAVDRLTIK